MLFNLKKEENSDMCYEKDERWRHCAQWKKHSQKDKYCNGSTHVKYRAVKFIGAESRMVVTSSWRKGRRGGYCLTGTKFQFHKMKSILDTGCPMLSMYLMSLQCTFKNG